MNYLMHINTGSIDTAENWKADATEWSFDDALENGHLVEVDSDWAINTLKKEPYGKLINHPDIVLKQDAYLSGTNENLYYEANGVDKDGNTYKIKWEIIYEDCEPEDSCDWDDYTITKI